MALHNYIRRRSHDNVAFAKFDCNPNFVPDDILLMLLHAQEVMKIVVLVG
jgi:hypothetical protein